MPMFDAFSKHDNLFYIFLFTRLILNSGNSLQQPHAFVNSLTPPHKSINFPGGCNMHSKPVTHVLCKVSAETSLGCTSHNTHAKDTTHSTI
jgi:hypothetical protein